VKSRASLIIFAGKRFSGEVTHLIKFSEKCPPEMKETINAKIVKVSRKLANVLDREEVAKHLNDLEVIFDRIEERLNKTKRGRLYFKRFIL
jgi:hypothetical protein